MKKPEIVFGKSLQNALKVVVLEDRNSKGVGVSFDIIVLCLILGVIENSRKTGLGMRRGAYN